MPLLIGTALICLATLWLMVLLIGGRNPHPPWWANDWVLADIQVPSLMLLGIVGFWFMTRFAGDGLSAAVHTMELLAAAGVVAATWLIIRQMKVGRRLKAFAEMEVDEQPVEETPAEPAQPIQLHRRLPWQVRLHLADDLGYDLAWIRSLRCVVHEVDGRSDHLRFQAFDPQQAKAMGLAIAGHDSLDGHPEMVLFSGVYAIHGQRVTIDSAPPRRAA